MRSFVFRLSGIVRSKLWDLTCEILSDLQRSWRHANVWLNVSEFLNLADEFSRWTCLIEIYSCSAFLLDAVLRSLWNRYSTRTCHTSFWLRSVAVPTIRPLKLQHTSRENAHLTVMVKTYFPFSSPSPLPVLFCVAFFQACLRNRGWSLRWLEGGSSFHLIYSPCNKWGRWRQLKLLYLFWGCICFLDACDYCWKKLWTNKLVNYDDPGIKF